MNAVCDALVALRDDFTLADVRTCGDDGAVFSPCNHYGFLLWRVWNARCPLWSFGMLNPSTADHVRLDATISRCQQRAYAGGAGGFIVWNLFAWRTPSPAALKRAEDPVGAFNDQAIRLAVAASAVNIAAWGVHGRHRARDEHVRAMLRQDAIRLHALAFTAEGIPRHPLYLPLALQPQPWREAG